MKKTIFTAMMVMCVGAAMMTGCGNIANASEQEVICGADESTWSPITDCESLAEAESVAGIDIRVPESIEDYDDISYFAMRRYQLVQVEYHQDEQHYICIRKAAGTEDISGDYNSYKEETAADVDGRQVTFKGNDGNVSLAVWSDGEYSYSVMAADLTTAPETGAGLSAEQMKTLVSEVG